MPVSGNILNNFPYKSSFRTIGCPHHSSSWIFALSCTYVYNITHIEKIKKECNTIKQEIQIELNIIWPLLSKAKTDNNLLMHCSINGHHQVEIYDRHAKVTGWVVATSF